MTTAEYVHFEYWVTIIHLVKLNYRQTQNSQKYILKERRTRNRQHARNTPNAVNTRREREWEGELKGRREEEGN